MYFYRDGIGETIDAPPKKFYTREGHAVEQYKVKGEDKFFVTLSGSHYCAHGQSIQEAITDAIWKDESQRPQLEELKQEIRGSGKQRQITLNEFKTLTGACSEGCRVSLKRAGLDGSPMTAHEIYRHFPEWGRKLLHVLEWEP